MIHRFRAEDRRAIIQVVKHSPLIPKSERERLDTLSQIEAKNPPNQFQFLLQRNLFNYQRKQSDWSRNLDIKIRTSYRGNTEYCIIETEKYDNYLRNTSKLIVNWLNRQRKPKHYFKICRKGIRNINIHKKKTKTD